LSLVVLKAFSPIPGPRLPPSFISLIGGGRFCFALIFQILRLSNGATMRASLPPYSLSEMGSAYFFNTPRAGSVPAMVASPNFTFSLSSSAPALRFPPFRCPVYQPLGVALPYRIHWGREPLGNHLQPYAATGFLFLRAYARSRMRQKRSATTKLRRFPTAEGSRKPAQVETLSRDQPRCDVLRISNNRRASVSVGLLTPAPVLR